MAASHNPQIVVVVIRQFRGVNLLDDARVGDPFSFTRLQNIYRKASGVLASRPGSVLIASGGAQQIDAPSDITPTTGHGGLGTSVNDFSVVAAVAEDIWRAEQIINRGPRGFVPRVVPNVVRNRPVTAAAINNAQMPVNGSLKVSVAPSRVDSLHRLYADYGGTKFLIGALDYEGGHGSRPFYVDESNPAAPVIRLMTFEEKQVGAGSQWVWVNYFKEDPDGNTEYGEVAKYYVLGSAQVGRPFAITLDTNRKPVLKTLLVRRKISGSGIENDECLRDVSAMVVYNGTVVYGGYNLSRYDTPETITNKQNFICFSEPGEPHLIAETDGVISDIRIGDSPYEPVTALAVNSVATDSLGVKGQLVVFTPNKVVTYDGLPPVSGNPTGVAFHSVALSTVGCNAPKTVVQTPAGLMFLGSDGLVYLIPRFSNGGPYPVSRAIEPALGHLSPRQQKQCAAVYDDGHYKLSYPEANATATKQRATLSTEILRSPLGNPGADVPNRQFWLDVRPPLDPQQLDFGLVWTGPHVGMKHSCFATATQYGDFNLLFAGSAIDGSIFQASVEGVASDPSPEDVTTTVPLVYDILMGQLDAGDIHVDKSIKLLQFGVNTNKTFNLVSSIIASGEVTGVEGGEQFTDPIAPVGYSFSTAATFASGTVFIAPRDSFRLLSKHPTVPRRGRTFRFRFFAEPSVATIIRLSDMTFIMEVHPRRD